MTDDIAAVKAFVRANAEIAPEHFAMALELENGFPRPDAGQFVMIRIEGNDVFLPRPFSIAGWDGTDVPKLKIIYRVIGAGTAMLSKWEAGKSVSLTGPLGRGFSMPADRRDIVLIGGGVGVAPLLYLLQQCAEAQGRGRAGRMVWYAGARTASAMVGAKLAEQFGADLMLCTDDGSEGFAGPVTERFAGERSAFDERTTSLYACGPRPMLQRLQVLLSGSPMTCEASLEERMACGLGACLGCAVAIRDEAGNRDYRRVCKEGPVFPLQDVLWD